MTCLPAPGVSSAFAGADVLSVKDHQATQILADLRQCGGAKVHSVTVATQRKWPSDESLCCGFLSVGRLCGTCCRLKGPVAQATTPVSRVGGVGREEGWEVEVGTC